MDSVSNALLFWQIVEESLVKLYGLDPSAAHVDVVRLRGRMTKAAIAQDVTYHMQPLHVANDIARGAKPISDAEFKAYQKLVRRVTAEWPQTSIHRETKDRKPRVNASKGSRPVAALSR